MPIRTWLHAILAACAALLVLSMAHPLRVAASAAQEPDAGGKAPSPLELPTRRLPDAPPAAPPLVPAGSDRIAPMTLVTAARRTPKGGPAQTREMTIARTVDRVRVETAGAEWLYERNIRDPRRVSAYLIDHASRAIILYEESDLRAMVGIRGWADVITLGFDVQLLGEYNRTGEARSVGGIRFGLYKPKRHDQVARDLWWSEEHLMSSEFVTADATGSTRFTIRQIRMGVDPKVLRPPDARFPAYRAFNLADWLERH